MQKQFSKAGLYAMALLVSMFFLTACDNKGDNTTDVDPDYDAYRGYVVSVRDTSDRYYDRDWAELERDYNERKARVEAKADKLDEKSRAEYNQLDADWAAFKARYDERRVQRDNEARLAKIRTELVETDDITFASVEAATIRDVYEKFIERVRNNRANYNSADWVVVNEVYRNLKARRQAVNDAIKGQDRLRITALETEYETTMAVVSPFSEEGGSSDTKNTANP